MTRPPPGFPITPRNRVKREQGLAHYDRETVFSILDSAMLCHVAWVDDGQPYCTPTLHWRQGNVLYWHGSSASRMIRHLAAPAPVCVTVTHFDGLVMARSAFNHSVNYRAAMCYGEAGLLRDPEAKRAALRAMVDRFFPGRYESLRPVTAQEIKATGFIAMTIDQASAKIRSGGVSVDPPDEAHPVWAGVIPFETRIGADQPCPRSDPVQPRPPGLAPFREGAPLDEVLRQLQSQYERG